MKHTFACFVQNLSLIINSGTTNLIELNDQDLFRRLFGVLRLNDCEFVVLFDESINAHVQLITPSKKKNVAFKIIEINTTKPPAPHISFLQCMTKKEAFEEIIYYAAQMGVNEIYPVLSSKLQKSWWSPRELERLQRIMISACEQSKNFAIPLLHEPVELSKLISAIKTQQHKICFDEEGQPLIDIIKNTTTALPTPISLLCGPEGGLAPDELTLLKENNFLFCKLTPTILRAKEAACVGIGIWRSLF